MTIFGISIVVLDWIINIIYVTLAVPITLLLIRYRHLTAAYKWFLFSMVAHITTSVTSNILYQNNINPNYAGSVFYIFALVVYIGFFVRSMDMGMLKPLFYGLTILHVAFASCNLLFIQKETINTYSAISHSLIIISLCLIFYYRLLKNLPTDNLLTLPIFWFVTAEFIVNTGQMLMKSFAHFLINIFNDNLIILWVFHHGLGIAGNLFVIYGCWLVFNRTRTTSGIVT